MESEAKSIWAEQHSQEEEHYFSVGIGMQLGQWINIIIMWCILFCQLVNYFGIWSQVWNKLLHKY